MKDIEVINKSTNSVSQMRNALFLPYVKIKHTSIYKQFIENNKEAILFENEYYKLEIMDYLLSQRHRDILDVILSWGLIELEGDRAFSAFTINSLLEALNLDTGTGSRKWLIKKLSELKRVNIKVTSKKHLSKYTEYNICDIAKHSDKLDQYLLVFSTHYLKMLSEDILIDYSKYLPHILKIKNSTVKAFVRYVLSHDWQNSTLDFILLEIEVKPLLMSKRNYQKIKKSIREYDFSIFGISVIKNKVEYTKREDIYFYNAQKEIKKRTNIPVKTNQYPSIENKNEPISHIKRTNIPVKTVPP